MVRPLIAKSYNRQIHSCILHGGFPLVAAIHMSCRSKKKDRLLICTLLTNAQRPQGAINFLRGGGPSVFGGTRIFVGSLRRGGDQFFLSLVQRSGPDFFHEIKFFPLLKIFRAFGANFSLHLPCQNFLFISLKIKLYLYILSHVT